MMKCLESVFGSVVIEASRVPSPLKASSTAATSTDAPSGADDEVGARRDGAGVRCSCEPEQRAEPEQQRGRGCVFPIYLHMISSEYVIPHALIFLVEERGSSPLCRVHA